MDITNEMNYIKMIKKEALLPSDALKLDETLNKILLAYSLLSCTIRWYNELIDNLMEYEKALLKDEWEKVCKDLNEGLEKKWIDNSNYFFIFLFVCNVLSIFKELYFFSVYLHQYFILMK